MTERARGRRGQEDRARWLRWHPLCAHCEKEGRATIGVEVDHIVPLHKGGSDDDTNKQTLCKAHHEKKTAADLGYTHKPKLKIGLDGFPIDSPGRVGKK